jgi:hypothetical protein
LLYIRIPSKGVLGVLDSLEIAPVVKLDSVSKKGENTVSVAWADAHYQVQGKRFVKIDDALLQLNSESVEGTPIGIFLKEQGW